MRAIRKVTIIGAGVTGLTTALAMHEAGLEIRVIDPNPPGSGTSAANGAQLSWAFVAPLAEPGVLTKLPGWLSNKDSPIRCFPQPDLALPAWGLRFLACCRDARVKATTASLLRLAAAGKPLLDSWRVQYSLDFDWRPNGKLVIYRDPRALAKAERQAALQRELGTEQEVMGVAELLAREPLLTPHREHLVGAVWTPGEAVGDCERFCQAAAAHLAAQGVVFDARRVAGLETRVGNLAAIRFTDGERHARDPTETVIVAAGLDSRRLLRPNGILLPLYPLKGYSLTLPLTRSADAFDASITDAERKIVYARLGEGTASRLRIAGIADLDGWHTRPRASRVALLKRQVGEFLPQQRNAIEELEPWVGLRPATPDGRPRLGPSGIEGLWLNVGHGALGWTLAPGSAYWLREALLERADTPAPQ